MKHLTLVLSLFLLASCAKDDRVIRYDATCDLCYIEYIGPNAKNILTHKVEGYWQYDTIPLSDTTYVVDSTRFSSTWSETVTMHHNDFPYMKVCDWSGRTPATFAINGSTGSVLSGCVRIEP